MEPTKSATPTNEAAGSSAADQPQNAQQNAGTQQTSGADTSGNTSNQQSGGAKNWMEQAGLQKIVDQLPQGVREFLPNSWEQINKLTTTQKVAGAVALAGLGYLAMRSGKSSDKSYGKSGGKYRGSYGGSAESQRPNQNYRSGSRVHPSDYSTSSHVDESRRMDKGPNRSTGASFDRQNENRVGSYNSDGSTYSSGAGLSDSDSSMGSRSTGYRGSSSGGSNLSGSDFGSGV
ncbi:hypothetical protein [Hymenobacter glacieicola]|uniref:DUF3300 domain-containing protein n=1 Tax=Hymenobacter glacieicola TaxID=1562124 RepID=A0ABQ1X8E0_9BACT|nr:hypothetical protein [Hymenobacter glacieicola]GGG62378.1 hypothetical protein GCM10011378_43140 [Hymenobacter glacieicola]